MIRCTISPTIRLEVCAPQRVAPPAVESAAALEGVSSMAAEAVCVCGGSVICAGGSVVEARGFAVRGGRAGIVGGGVVTAAAQVRHNMEEIKRIFGLESIEILVASDGAGGVIEYSTPSVPIASDTLNSSDVAPVTSAFRVTATEVFPSGNVSFNLASPPKTFSAGIFVGSASDNSGIALRVNHIYLYPSTLGRLMIRDAKAGINYYSNSGLANYDTPDFWVISASESSQEMIAQGSGGKMIVSSYPAIMDYAYFGLGSLSGNVTYVSQFWILLNRLMTDTEIASVRALL